MTTFVRSEEQELLAQTAREFVRARAPVKRLRDYRDRHDPDGFSRELWSEMAGLGWLGIVIPEAHGGAGLGWTDLMVVLEELGRGLAPEPLLSTVLLGATALLLGGSDEQRRAHLSAVAAGERLLAVAFQEPAARYDLRHTETRAERSGSGWRLTGTKAHVLGGQVADHLIVAARAAGAVRDADGVTLFLVPRAAAGVDVERQWRVDGRGAALVHLRDVVVGADAIVGRAEQGVGLLQQVVDRATIALTAEMLGAMTAAFESTLEHLKTRTQFGVPIGTFQALKHRAARLFVETELVRSIVVAAHRALDDGTDERQVARLAAAAKARASEAYVLIANEAVQMHGGIGMTDEHDIGLYLKHARGTEILFGDAAFQRDRVAGLDGY